MTLNIVIFVIRFINIIVTPFTLRVVFRNANHGKIPLDNYLLDNFNRDTDHHYGMVTFETTIREAVVDEETIGVDVQG